MESKNAKVFWIKNVGNVAVVESGSNDIHFQAIDCQTNFMHQVDAIEKVRNSCSNSDYRLVFSGQATMHFQYNEDIQLRRTIIHFFDIYEKHKNQKLPKV